MKRSLFSLCLTFALMSTALAGEPLKLLYSSSDAPLAQALANDAVTLIADPTLKDIFQPNSMLISKDGLTDNAISQLGIKREQLLRLVVAAKTAEKVTHLEDAYNGKVDSSIFYLYTMKPSSEQDLALLKAAASAWYSTKVENLISQAGYTPLPAALTQQNRVTLELDLPQFPHGYR